MKTIVHPRQGGKTTELIKISAETGQYIVCLDRKRIENIMQIAQNMKVQIPFPITLEELMRGNLKGGSVQRDGVLVDDYDVIVRYIVNDAFQGIERKAVSLTDNKLTDDVTEIENARKAGYSLGYEKGWDDCAKEPNPPDNQTF